MKRLLTGLGATLLIAVLLVGLPAGLLATWEIGLPHIEPTPSGVWRALLAPDDGTVFLTLLKLIGWAAWAVLAVSVITEIIARLRHVRVPSLRGLAVPQALARGLVATAATLFVTTSGTITQLPPASAGPASPIAAPAHPGPAAEPEHAPQARRFERYVVKKGDTLSQIALDHLGNGHRYPEIYRASKPIHQPGGARLTDPDVIDIGWKLNIPNPAAAERQEPRATTDETPRGEQATPERTAHAEGPLPDASPPVTPTPPEPAASADATPHPGATATTARSATPTPHSAEQPLPTAEAEQDTVDSQPGWLVAGLAGAGAILAGSLWLALRQRRAQQSRHRPLGRTIATPPPELLPIEKTLIHLGKPISDVVTFVDHALRRLATTLTAPAEGTLPQLIAVEVATTSLTLHLAGAQPLPRPWSEGPGPNQWSLTTADDHETVGPLDPDGPAPWPHLVTIGQDDNGHWWLLNLEHAGIAAVTGDPDYAQDITRYLAAELATNPWTRDLEVDLIQICPEIRELDPDRIHVHADAEGIDATIQAAVETVDRLARTTSPDAASARVRQDGDELWGSRVVVVAGDAAGNLDQLTHLIDTMPGRTSAAVLLLGTDAGPGTQIDAGTDGRVHVPSLGLDLSNNGLTVDEARGCVQLLQAGDNLDGADVPAAASADQAWQEWADQAGNLRGGATTARRIEGGGSSVLPASDAHIMATTATTVEDLAALAPGVAETAATQVAAADPNLDADVAEWFADSSNRPKLMVLGDIKVRVGRGGEPQAGAGRKRYYAEIVAYLTSRPNGATTEELCEAFATNTSLIRKDIAIVRKWLGRNPATGTRHLPDATESPAGRQRGIGVYQALEVLSDADLLRRLRVRGQTRGPAGIEDFLTALKLVTGTPYSELRTGGGIWLADTRDDQHLLVAIVDLAHLVVTMALQTGDLDTARTAAEIAARAAPDEETPKLDLAAIAQAQGRLDEADRIGRAISNQRDHRGPVEPGPRSDEILRTRGWGQRRARAS